MGNLSNNNIGSKDSITSPQSSYGTSHRVILANSPQSYAD